MVGFHGHLDIIDSLPLLEGVCVTSVVDQNVQLRLCFVDVCGELPDGCEGTEVQFLDDDFRVLRCVNDVVWKIKLTVLILLH